MAEYHKYVFDTERRAFVGKFEEMYQQENVANFDSWHQEDSRQLNRKIALDMLDQFNFNTILDIGCGKGALTHLLKKRNNRVIGVDISPTAIEVARSRFPDINFDAVDVSDLDAFDVFINNNYEGGWNWCSPPNVSPISKTGSNCFDCSRKKHGI